MLINANAEWIPLADKLVHTVVTSPPYWSLRDYGTAEWVGGDSECDHVKHKRSSLESGLRNDGREHKGLYEGEKATEVIRYYADACGKCGAKRVDKQLGLETTPEAYVSTMVAVFREVRRVMRDDATLWLNMGDSYNGSGGAGGDYNEGGLKAGQPKYPGRMTHKLKPLDLCNIPHRLASALQADGWYWRSTIVWHKPNPMPESVNGWRWERCRKKVSRSKHAIKHNIKVDIRRCWKMRVCIKVCRLTSWLTM